MKIKATETDGTTATVADTERARKRWDAKYFDNVIFAVTMCGKLGRMTRIINARPLAKRHAGDCHQKPLPIWGTDCARCGVGISLAFAPGRATPVNTHTPICAGNWRWKPSETLRESTVRSPKGTVRLCSTSCRSPRGRGKRCWLRFRPTAKPSWHWRGAGGWSWTRAQTRKPACIARAPA